MKSWNPNLKALSKAIVFTLLLSSSAFETAALAQQPVDTATAGRDAGGSVQPAVQAPAVESPNISSESSPVSDDTMSGAQGLLGPGTRTMGAMIFVLGLILAAVVLLKRFMPHRFGPLGHKRRIQVLETIPIGEKRSLTLVEIDGASLLLASTPGSISLVKEIPAREEPARAVQEIQPVFSKPAARKSQSAPRFADALAAEVRSTGSAVPAALTPLTRLSSLRRQLEGK